MAIGTMDPRLGAEPGTMFSRISWGAIFAGVFVSFVVLLLLNVLGLAVGLTGRGDVGTGTAIWAVVSALVALFAGGYVCSRLVSSETRGEAAIHGTVLWGVLFFGLLMLAVSGIQLGLTALGGLGNVVNALPGVNAEQLGLTAEQMNQLRATQVGGDPATGVWWTFVGMIVSLVAVIGGAMSGGRFASERPATRRVAYTREQPAT